MIWGFAPPTTLTFLEADLLAFHAKTYGRKFQHDSLGLDSLLSGSETIGEDEPYDEDDDGLGYYPDGVKRTLTDEQIAIFRHSEIHALLRERELVLQDETREDDAQTREDRISSPSSNPEGDQSTSPKVINSTTGTVNEAKDEDDEGAIEDDDDDDAEYAAFLAREREEFSRATAAQRRQHTPSERMGPTLGSEDPRKISTRRKVREMDAPAASFNQALMYDEDDMVIDSGSGLNYDDEYGGAGKATASATTTLPQVKRIWWPTIGKNG